MNTRCFDRTPRHPHMFLLAVAAWLVLAAVFFVPRIGTAQSGADIAELHRQFAHPPDSSRIMMRWWWFGPAATKPEITRELEQMKAAGIGGAEIANLYPLALDDPATGFHNTPFLSDEHLEALRFANQEAKRLGLRLDITLCSGWPFGGPHIPITRAAGKLRTEAIPVPAGETRVRAPFIDQGETLMAAFLADGADTPRAFAREAATAQPVSDPAGGWYTVPAAQQARTLIAFVSSRTGMMVKRPSVGAAGFVLDHYDHAAIETHLHAVGDKLLAGFGERPPFAVFSDSLEDYASDWTPKLLDEFRKRRGYDLRPHLPALVMNSGAETAAVRRDWGRTLTELADDNFLKPMEEWARKNHTLLRSQTYGFPPVTLWSNRIADLPEGEGKATFMMWREFSDTRWAASAGHIFHRPVISSETWTWLDSPAFRATPLDMKAEADLHFLQGINQLVGHGWPYSPPMAGEPGWRMYAAAALNAHNPWFFAMPDLTAYLQRVSFALRQGQPVNDVALLLPNDDVWSNFFARFERRASPTSAAGFDESGSNVTIDESMEHYLGNKVIGQIVDAGYNLDFIDADIIDNVGIPYRALVLPDVNRLPVATYEKILAFARKGGTVIATKRMPSTAPGLMKAEEDSARLKELSKELFQSDVETAKFVEDEQQLGGTLRHAIPPAFTLTPETPEIGFIYRKVAGGDLFFVANTSNAEKQVRATFATRAGRAEIWNAFTGGATPLADAHDVKLDIEAYGSRLIFFSDALDAAPPEPVRHAGERINLTDGWTATIDKKEIPADADRNTAWSGDPVLQYYSGTAEYRRSFDVSLAGATKGTQFLLCFNGAQTQPLPSPPGEHNMRAYIQSPVAEAAEVYVNGTRAGVVWRPPFQLNIAPYLREGRNELRVVAGNTAINELAGQSLPDYRLLWDRYGMLFVPQDFQGLKPLPSGMLGPVELDRSDVERSDVEK